MVRNDDKWVAAYYPFEMINNQHSKTIMCLLFDRVICHFPVADMACGGGHGASNDLFGHDPLVEADVIELREEILLDEIPGNFSPGHFWGTEEEGDLYRRLQVTGMSMNACFHSGNVPLTDVVNCPVPASILQKMDLKRFARLQASALAIQSLKIALPPFAEISDEDILEARQQLEEQLIRFRDAMLALSPAVRHGIQNDCSLSEIHSEAHYLAETHIFPALQDLRKKLAMEKGKFWRRLVLQGSRVVPNFFLNWTTKNALTAAINAVDATKNMALDVIRQEETLEAFRAESGLGYLLDIADNPIFDDQGLCARSWNPKWMNKE